MRSKKVNIPLGPPLAQDRCLLFTLPAEIRNVIYELALGMKVIGDDEQAKTNEARQVVITRKPSGYLDTPPTLLSTCRLIYSEAAEMLLGQYHIRVGYDTLISTNSTIPQSGFLDQTSKLRLAGIVQLTVKSTYCHDRSDFQQVSMACKRLRRLPKLKKLTFVLGVNLSSAALVHSFRVEKYFLKSAIKKLASVAELRFELPHTLAQVHRVELEKLAALLPSRVDYGSSVTVRKDTRVLR